ncbi:hypothetical protein GCM10023192_38340 [Amycolatopsis samaneae]
MGRMWPNGFTETTYFRIRRKPGEHLDAWESHAGNKSRNCLAEAEEPINQPPGAVNNLAPATPRRPERKPCKTLAKTCVPWFRSA